MKKQILIAALLFSSYIFKAQVGINTTTPNLSSDLTLGSSDKGLLLNRVSLVSTSSSIPLSAHVAGMTVYNNATAGDVTPGIYYNDGTKWIKTSAGTAATPWNIQGSTNPAASNTQAIYQNKNVAVGDFTGTVSTKQFEVAGDIKTSITNGTITHALETNRLIGLTGAGVKPWNLLSAAGPNETSFTGVSQSEAIVGIGNNDGSFSTLIAQKDNIRTVVGNFNTAYSQIASNSSGISLSAFSNGALSNNAAVNVNAVEGVKYTYQTSTGTAEGSYIFPRVNGTPGQVLTTDGNAATAVLAWKDPATGTEPWNIQGSTTPATSNTQAIYQNKNVAVGNFTGNTSTKQFEVAGDLKASITNGTTISTMETNNPSLGNLSSVSDNVDPTAAAATGSFLVQKIDNTSWGTKTPLVTSGLSAVPSRLDLFNGNQAAGNFSTATFSQNFVTIRTRNTTDGFFGAAGVNDKDVFLESDNLTNNQKAAVNVNSAEGVKYTYQTSTGAAEGSYILPRVNGNPGQVLTTDGNAATAVLAWKDPAAITNIVKVTADYTTSASDHTILANAANGGFTLTLPNAAANKGRILIIRKTDETNNVLTFSQNIKFTENTDITSVNSISTTMIQSDGTNWYQIN
ncbi:hypothetical protein [Chryseobacterium soli]|uniref:hypothetical protein n=1 Tax=Chryseobacterium soli TaxID=445961 RepID=UPI00068C2D52|nr:hypothetical protein [Chryseobacterium soli]